MKDGLEAAVRDGVIDRATAERLVPYLAGSGLAAAWRTTRKNRIAYLGFTFWLLFTLAIAGAIGAGAFFAQQNLPQPWVKPVVFALIGVLSWLTLLLLASVAAGHYRAFAERP